MEEDPESGEVTAYNDDVRVMAIGENVDEAMRRFREALAALVLNELKKQRPLPASLQQYVHLTAHA